MRPQLMFAAFNDRLGWDLCYLNDLYRYTVADCLHGNGYATWREAYNEGWRIIKVEVRPVKRARKGERG